MTLSRFLRDYIYIPLGGNKNGNFRTYVNLMATFVIGGFWHGAGWTFLFWGFLHGLALCIHRVWSNLGFKMWTWLAWFITFNFVNVAWIFFRAKEWEDAIKVLKGMCGLSGVVISTEFANAMNYLNPMIDYFKLTGIKYTGFVNIYIFEMIIISFIMVLGFKNSMQNKNNFYMNSFKFTIFSIILIIISLFAQNTYSEFLYFNF